MNGITYRFDSSRTDYAVCFMIEGDKVGYLADPIIPPAGTIVTLSDGQQVTVIESRLDLSNGSGLAVVYVACEPAEKPAPVPLRVR